MSVKNVALFAGLMAMAYSSSPAYANANEEMSQAEQEVVDVCTEEFPMELKEKNFTQITAWIEKIEHGEHGDEFKNSKCYDAHENWEQVAAKSEDSQSAHSS